MAHADSLALALERASRFLGAPITAAVILDSKRDPTLPLDLSAAVALAESQGLTAAEGVEALSRLPEAAFPVLAVPPSGEAVAVLAREGDGAYRAQRADDEAPVVLNLEALGFDGSAPCPLMLLSKPATVRPSGPHWFWSAFQGQREAYSQILLAAALTNILGLSTSLFIMVVYDRVVPNEAIESLFALTLGVALALIFDFIIKTLRGFFIDAVSEKADLKMARRIFDHLLALRLGSRKGSAGAFASTVREFETLREFFTSASLVALVDVPFILLFVLVIYAIGGPLAIVPLLAVPIVFGVGLAIQPFLRRLAENAFEEGQSKQGVLVEAVSGLETIKATGAAPMLRARWEAGLRGQSTQSRKNRALQQLALNASTFTQQAAQIVIICYAVFLIRDGVISMGAMIACVILTGRTLAPLTTLAQTLSRMNQARTAFGALNQLMALPTDRPAAGQALQPPVLTGAVSFHGVSFTYPEQAEPALTGLNFSIVAGEKVALLGRVGSGKSTALRLLLGLYAPSEGSVRVDGTDLRQLEPAALRSQMGTVLQDAWLFSGTLRENLTLGDPRWSDADLLAAAQLTGAHEFIGAHPEGFDRKVAERGEGLSGGQRQLLCLTRALLGAPPLLLLDEPTSAMDTPSERALIERLAADPTPRTLIVVTHRSSLLALVDRVIVLDKGRVIADGPKEQVLRPASSASGSASGSAGEGTP